MKTNIKMRVTPEQSKKVQEICFENSIYWWSGRKIVIHVDCPFLFIGKNNITQSENESFYIGEKEEEIDADLFIRTNGTCEEDIYGKVNQYQPLISVEIKELKDDITDLSDKLKKKNEILKKARIKRKNQREELHKLNIKLQKCIDFEEYNEIINFKNEIIRELENENYLNKSKLHLSSLNNVAQAKEIEKLKAVIEYLESKVK